MRHRTITALTSPMPTVSGILPRRDLKVFSALLTYDDGSSQEIRLRARTAAEAAELAGNVNGVARVAVWR